MEKKKTEIISVKELIESGVHFGHTTTKWNPRMKPYLFGKQNGIHIIDIKHTLKGLITAYYYLRELAKKNGMVLFVGTKRQAQSVIKEEATRCNMPYVSERWLGGTLTNFDTIRLRLSKLVELEKMETDGTITRLNKKELSMHRRELEKLRHNLGGIRNMAQLPQALVVVDYKTSKIAINESKKMRIKTIGLIDTDGDPTGVNISIPANDDAERVIQIIISKLADAIIEGRTSAGITGIIPLVAESSKESVKKDAVKPGRGFAKPKFIAKKKTL